jgi:hypothetical protein
MNSIRLAIVVAALISAAGLLRGQPASEPIKIGFIVPLSGPIF